jgi:hypothetical protein
MIKASICPAGVLANMEGGDANMSIPSIFTKKSDDRQVPEIEVKGDEVTLVGKDTDAEDRTVKMPKTKFA